MQNVAARTHVIVTQNNEYEILLQCLEFDEG